MVRQVERELAGIAFVVFSPPAVALQIACAHHQTIRPERNQLAGHRETSRTRFIDAVHPETSLEVFSDAL